jgi:hypothetical protein
MKWFIAGTLALWWVLMAALTVYTCHGGARSGDPMILAADLVTACPLGDDPADAVARDRCADKLAELPSLAAVMVEPFVWGGAPARGYSLEKGTTRLAGRVWRKLYLSTFMFGDGAAVERVGGDVILHVPVWFRYALPPEAFAYPFWHKPAKWTAYNRATTIHFVFRDGRLIGALRGAEQDPTRPDRPRRWDEQWGAPPVTLFSYLFSPDNPHVPRLDAAYRALEAGMRPHRCAACHAPDNKGGADQLEILVYPAQALAARHDIAPQLADDQMPTADPETSAPGGIGDPAERERLISLAQAFAAEGDDALAWEGRP